MYNISTLARLCEVTERTVRYYVSKEVIPPPGGKKRGSFYTDIHLRKIKRVKNLLKHGFQLKHIKEIEGRDGEEICENLNKNMCAEKSKKYLPKLRYIQREYLCKNVELIFPVNSFSEGEIEKIKKVIIKIKEERIIKNKYHEFFQMLSGLNTIKEKL